MFQEFRSVLVIAALAVAIIPAVLTFSYLAKRAPRVHSSGQWAVSEMMGYIVGMAATPGAILTAIVLNMP